MNNEMSKKFMGSKKAVSPVVATVLLVVVVIILIAIIFLWARRFIPEAVIKNEKAIEQSCVDVDFQAQMAGNALSVKNTGNVPISSLSIAKISKLKKDTIVIKVDLSKGDAKSIGSSELGELSGYEKINVIPMLLGSSKKSGKLKEYACSEDTGKEIEV